MQSRLWETDLASRPYARAQLHDWQMTEHQGDVFWDAYEDALNTYLASGNELVALAQRYKKLVDSRAKFSRLKDQGDQHIATSFALTRIAIELEEFAAAGQTIDQLVQLMPWLVSPLPSDLRIRVNRPFVAPVAVAEQRLIDDDLGDWLQWAVKEARNAVNTRV